MAVSDLQNEISAATSPRRLISEAPADTLQLVSLARRGGRLRPSLPEPRDRRAHGDGQPCALRRLHFQVARLRPPRVESARPLHRQPSTRPTRESLRRLAAQSSRMPDGHRMLLSTIIRLERVQVVTSLLADAFHPVSVDIHQLVRLQQRLDLRPHLGQ